ncbi:sacsin N-terminal ATP-binding-like domain-containing protein [Nocardia uniformis]|uniref:sacsin N-terminal ATP-binding-like domain-containing protein n=1 Tax=Nocardia uniformis TaxID=53432 RepID=UPI001FDFBD89|nr:ATP-binding protein [Nocardia uniformis]
MTDGSGVADPFGTRALRDGVLAAWRGSPTRLREDAATEADLVRAGYRDRVLTELAQNAADAAAKAGVAGRIAVWGDGGMLHVANTGVALDVSGVHALTALRASSKVAATSVGRFGVGFTAVLSVAEEIEFRSTRGSVRFSRAATWEALRESGITVPETEHPFTPPALRLAWPVEDGPVAGFDSEIVLRLRDGVDGAALLAGMRAEVSDLLLELPALRSIRIEDDEIVSAVRDLADGLQEVRISGPRGQERRWWQYRTARARWLLPLRDGDPVAAAPDVLRAPTRSDEELSLPALLIADIPMQPDRRRLLPGVRIADLAAGYADFARALPPRARLTLVPTPGFPRSEADAQLRAALVAELREHTWLPVLRTDDDSLPAADPFGVDDELDGAAPGGEALRRFDTGHGVWREGDTALNIDATERIHPTLDARAASTVGQAPGLDPETITSRRDDSEVGALAPLDELAHPPHRGARDVAVERPARASVFIGVTDELAQLLAEIVGPLVIPDLSGRSTADALGVLDVHRLGLARIAELSGSLERPAQWWYSYYDALEPFVTDPLAVEELGALAVPLADGRLVTGPRTVVLDDHLESAVPVHWARLVHPEAVHPLLERLGARQAGAAELLNDSALRDQLEHDPGDPDTVEAVLSLAAHLHPDSGYDHANRATAPGTLPTWLGLIELPDDTGESVPADELLLPGAPLGSVLVEDSPFSTVAADVVERYGPGALRAVGVGWGFTIVAESDPTGPDHHLDDEDTWWEGLAEDPPELLAVRDLDLVDEATWPEALRLLLSDPGTRPLLADRDGYTAWWLRRHAHIDGTPLGLFRHPVDPIFDGLLPQLPGIVGPDLDALRAVLADPEVITTDLAAELLAALADSSKTPTPEAISRTHRRLAEATATGRLDLEDLVLPERVRALSGTVIDAADALVLDRPWYGSALPTDRLVVGDIDSAPALASLLDLPLASQAVTAEVLGPGRRTSWSAEPLGVLWLMQTGLATPAGDLVVHEELRVRLSGSYEATVAVPWWRDGDDTHIAQHPADSYRE